MKDKEIQIVIKIVWHGICNVNIETNKILIN